MLLQQLTDSGVPFTGKNEYSKEAVFSEAEIVLVYIDVSEKTAECGAVAASAAYGIRPTPCGCAARRSFSTAFIILEANQGITVIYLVAVRSNCLKQVFLIVVLHRDFAGNALDQVLIVDGQDLKTRP